MEEGGFILDKANDHPARANSRNCFVCGPDNDRGLHLVFYQKDESTMAADVDPRPEWCGWDGVMHGGFQCVLLDEVTAWAASVLSGRPHMVTTSLEVKYRKTVSLSQKLRLEGRIVSQTHRGCTAQGRLMNLEGQVLSEAKAKVLFISEERLQKLAETNG